MENENSLPELLDTFINLLRSKELEDSEENTLFLNRLFNLKRQVSAEIKYLRDGDPRLNVGKVLLENIANEIKKEIYFNNVAFAEYREAGEDLVLIKGNENAVKALLKQADILGIKWKNVDFNDRVMDMKA
ncbi:hypothetical protein [Methanobacterium sp. ACI-7]|uniref:hypothetical protein n=1 Tax=unclassified Methanobacterium TaxID=2627676 RepID=UPI0039C28E9A